MKTITFRVRIEHYRIPEFPFLKYPKKGKPNPGMLYRYSRKFGFVDMEFKPYVRGGKTVCYLEDENGELIASGEVLCLMSDNYNYKTGRLFATKYAIMNLLSVPKYGGKLPKITKIHKNNL